MRSLIYVLMLCLLLFFVPACSVNKAYVAADRATFDAVAPEYLMYVEADVALDEKQKERRRETIRSWEARTGAAEIDSSEEKEVQ